MKPTVIFRQLAFGPHLFSFLWLSSLVLATTLLSCESPTTKPKAKIASKGCVNSNAILNENAYDSPAYLNELSKELFTRNEAYLEYFFLERIEKNGKSYLLVEAKDRDFCAKLLIRVYDWSGLQKIIQGTVKPGARMEGLEFASLKKGGVIEFMYQGITEIY